MKTKLLGVVAALAFVTATLMATASQANSLVVNGSFAGCTGTSNPAATPGLGPPTCDGWTFTPAPGSGYGATFFMYNNGQFGPSPTYAAFGGEAQEYDKISQDIATVAGETYVVSFTLITDQAGTESSFLAVFGSDTLLSLYDAGPTTWTSYTYDVVATASTTTLAFYGYNQPSWDAVTDASVAPTPVPATLPLFATGLGALGLLGWRRKRKAAIAAA
jgi:hypothetical protein